MALKCKFTEDKKGLIVDDPIHGKFEVSSLFSKIIFTKEMQRLQDITQTGFSTYDYPELANEDRLSHCVGAFFIMSKMIKQIEQVLAKYHIQVSEKEKNIALCAMLIHDVGHGPYSHNSEEVLQYSHEKRTADIVLGDTELNDVLRENFSEKDVRKIASFISDIQDEKQGGNVFTNLFKSLVSNQLDADRLDYLLRDSYYVGKKLGIDIDRIIQALGINVRKNREYELTIDMKALSYIENIFISRFQNHREIYYTKSDLIMTKMFPRILELYAENPGIVNDRLPEDFQRFALDTTNLSLKEFLRMTNTPFDESFDIIKNSSTNLMLAYLCDKDNISDYTVFENGVTSEEISKRLAEIFPNKDFSQSISVFSEKKSAKLYKQGVKMNDGKRIRDLSEVSSLINPSVVLEKNLTFFNSELLRLELGLTEKEFNVYRERVNKMIQELSKTPEEFELKYIVSEDSEGDKDLQKRIIEAFRNNSFTITQESEKENNDNYYDDLEVSILKSKGSLRIRQRTQDGKTKCKGTYKMPNGEAEVYTSRQEIEGNLKDNSLSCLLQMLETKGVQIKSEDIIPNPILNALTNRKDVVFDKDGVRVCVSFDNTSYTNHILENSEAQDRMIEIEAMGDINDRVILNDIHTFLTEEFSGLQLNDQSKYERGVQRTREMYKQRLKDKEKEER